MLYKRDLTSGMMDEESLMGGGTLGYAVVARVVVR